MPGQVGRHVVTHARTSLQGWRADSSGPRIFCRWASLEVSEMALSRADASCHFVWHVPRRASSGLVGLSWSSSLILASDTCM